MKMHSLAVGVIGQKIDTDHEASFQIARLQNVMRDLMGDERILG